MDNADASYTSKARRKKQGANTSAKARRKKQSKPLSLCARGSIVWLPSPKQVAIVKLLIDPDDKRSIEAKCAACGVPKRTFYNWRQLDAFNRYIQDKLDELMEIDEPDVYKSLKTQVKRGNVQAIRTYYEVRGKLNKRVRVEHTGDGGGPVRIASRVFAMSDEDLRRLAGLSQQE